ncbi:Glycosyl transferase group 1 [Pseudodesulfovibrio profundus]|uniref:Glycosyl transferase group 1 n=1 Tax=Pseudodesulfovibrio profundus TaxID=57320 RepID=A0A2C8FE78_9BACT|nr:glycosyltransferase family 4 protein [Pseudodesulfovibrio profundus]MBC17014.1 4-alpha-glucanotransferase [Desulfovibrio sp.]SOB60476.1 Glycosyl transferase group 1 [Pseudodesulfovibrio profundus]
MRVLMFGWEFPPYISGGLGTACYGLTKGLAQHGTDVLFVLPRLDTNEEGGHLDLIGANRVRASVGIREILDLQEHVSVLEVLSPLRPYLTEKAYLSLVKREELITAEDIIGQLDSDFSGGYGENLMAEIVRYSLVAGHLAKHEQFDVIHAHDWMTAPAGIEAKRVSGKPLVVHAHALEFDRSGEHVNQQVYDLERAGFEAADRIIAVSHFTRDTIIKRYSINPDKITVVHNAVSKERRLRAMRIEKPFPEKLVLFLGRITFQKGPDYFVEAAAKVLAQNPNIRFAMAGSGDMFPRMVERMAELRLADRFHFLGFVRGMDVERIYAMSDLYVMPSVTEPFGITPLEAMVYDVPSIVSKQSGVAEIMENAVKIDFWDVDRLAFEILDILENEDRAALLKLSGRRTLKRVQWEHAAEKVIHVYDQLVGGAV